MSRAKVGLERRSDLHLPLFRGTPHCGVCRLLVREAPPGWILGVRKILEFILERLRTSTTVILLSGLNPVALGESKRC